MRRTSRPKNPNTGHAPIIQNATPAAKLTMHTNAISAMKPPRLNDRCGVSRAENSICSAGSGPSKSLPDVMGDQYIPIMPKITRRPPVKLKTATRKGAPKPWKSLAANPRQQKFVAAKLGQPAGPKTLAKKSEKPSTRSVKSAGKRAPRATKPWTAAEVYEAFARFRKAN